MFRKTVLSFFAISFFAINFKIINFDDNLSFFVDFFLCFFFLVSGQIFFYRQIFLKNPHVPGIHLLAAYKKLIIFWYKLSFILPINHLPIFINFQLGIFNSLTHFTMTCRINWWPLKRNSNNFEALQMGYNDYNAWFMKKFHHLSVTDLSQ